MCIWRSECLLCLSVLHLKKKRWFEVLLWGVQRGQDKPLILLNLTPAVAAGTGMFSWCLTLPCSGIKRNISILWKWIQRVKQPSALFLLYQQLKPAFMKEVDSHFTEFVNSLVAKSALLDSSSSGSLFPASCSEKELHKAKYVSFSYSYNKVMVPGSLISFLVSNVLLFVCRTLRAPPEHGKIFTARRSLLEWVT